jgi:hypothetical protein
MKHSLIKLGSLILLATVACTPKPGARNPHQGKREWHVQDTKTELRPASAGEFGAIDLKKLEARVNGPVQELDREVIQVLSPFIWNPAFSANPANAGLRLEMATNILHTAFARMLEAKGLETQRRKALLAQFEEAVFAECAADLRRGCVNARLFSMDASTSRILYFSAMEDEAELDQLVKTHGGAKACIDKNPRCLSLVHLRYRRLAMAFSLKRSQENDHDLSFAYMKYARLLSEIVRAGGDVGYLSQTFNSIFEVLINRYKPKDLNAPEFRKFVENFNPWTFSNRKSDVFRNGSKAMFDLAAQCCLYADAAKTKLAESMKTAIKESQAESDADGPAFHLLVTKLLGNPDSRVPNVLSNLGMTAVIPQITNLNSDFYDEYFFLIDRLFKGHLESSQAMRILERTNPERAKARLLNVIEVYMKVHLANLTMESIDFMTPIWNSKQVSSNEIFQEAIMMSRELSWRWMRTQERLGFVDFFVGSYFKRFSIVPQEYTATTRLIKSFNRNLHYVSVYPLMIAMSYFLMKNQGVIKATSWWGAVFEITPDTVIDGLFEGAFEQPWFKFAADSVALSRERLFLAFHYALKTRALEAFTVEENDKTQSDRAKFFELTLGKFIEKDRRTIEEVYQKVERDVLGTPVYNRIEKICRFEMTAPGTPGVQTPPVMDIQLLELAKFTYVGQGTEGIAAPIPGLIAGDLNHEIARLFETVEPRLIFVKAVIRLVEDHMLAAGEIKDRNEANKELGRVKAILTELEDRQRRIHEMFLKYHKPYFECGRHLHAVELLRSYRLYEEEKKHLGQIHEYLTEIRKSPAAQRSAMVDELNAKHFPRSKVKFDALLSDGYKFSRYDFLVRVKDRVERDIFKNPSAADQAILREKGHTSEEIARIVRPRAVRVHVPPGLEVMEFYTKGEAETILYSESKDEFIREGLKRLNGKAGAYAEWMAQADQVKSFQVYLDTLIHLYLRGEPSVRAADILETFKKIVGLIDMNSVDAEMARTFGLDGLTKIENLEDFVVEKTSLRSQPLLRYITKKVYQNAGFATGAQGLIQRGRTLSDMLSTEGVIIFDPGQGFRDSLVQVYGEPIRRILGRATELFATVQPLEKDPQWRALLSSKIRVEDSNVIEIQSARGRSGGDVIDVEVLEDLRKDREEFTRKTDNLFGTR